MKFTRDWFQDKKNQVSTIQDVKLFNLDENKENVIEIGGHFLVDLIPVYDNGSGRDSTDVEIWEVENTGKKHNVKGRGILNLKPIRKITTGKQFGYPNGYWKIPEFALHENQDAKQKDRVKQ